MVMAVVRTVAVACGLIAPKGDRTPVGLARPRCIRARRRGAGLRSAPPRGGGWAALGRSHLGLEASTSAPGTCRANSSSACSPPHHLLHPFLKVSINQGVIAEVRGRKEGDVWMVGATPASGGWADAAGPASAGEQEIGEHHHRLKPSFTGQWRRPGSTSGKSDPRIQRFFPPAGSPCPSTSSGSPLLTFELASGSEEPRPTTTSRVSCKAERLSGGARGGHGSCLAGGPPGIFGMAQFAP